MVKSTITAKIDALLAQKRISKATFYKECSITSASYSQWNTGKTSPKMKNLYRIAEFLDVSVEYLLSENEQKKEAPSLDGKELTDAEQTLLTLFRQIPAEKQEAILGLIESTLRVQGLL